MNLDARLRRLELLEHAGGSGEHACACPFDYDRALAALAGANPVCPRCGRPPTVAVELVDYGAEGGWR